MKRLPFSLLGALLFALSGQAAYAATLYVDNYFGDDTDNDRCRKTTPCFSIQHAINMGGRSARILVNPGYYNESLTISEDNVKIYSTAGPTVTSIAGVDSANDYDNIITVTGKNFVLGAKGKGFNISGGVDDSTPPIGPNGYTFVALSLNGENPKIEGNMIAAYDYPDFNNTDSAIWLNTAQKATVRYNQIIGWKFGIDRIDTSTRSTITISDNEISDIGSNCIYINSGPRSADKITRNKIFNCVNDRIVDGYTAAAVQLEYPEPGTTSRPKVTDNQITDNLRGIVVGSNVRPLIQQNSLINTFQDEDFPLYSGEGIVFYGNTQPTVKDNVFQNTYIAMETGDYNGENVSNAVVTGNNVLDAETIFYISQDDTSPFKQVRKNNFGNVIGDECVIHLSDDDYSGGPIQFKQNYWGLFSNSGVSGNEPDLSSPECAGTNTETVAGNGQLTFDKPTDKPFSIRFKDKIN